MDSIGAKTYAVRPSVAGQAGPPARRSTRRGLHQSLGNQGLQRLLHAGLVQAKLTVSPPDDAYEQEADLVADEVMRMPQPAAARGPPPRIQRLCAECEEKMQRKAPVEDEEPLVQAKREGAELEDGAAAIAPYVDNLSGRGEPLSPASRAFFEPRFGVDFSAVRVHTDAAADRSAAHINALAYTTGPHVVFRAGRYDPASEQGRGLLAHELTHVVQQNRLASTAVLQRQTGAAKKAFSKGDLVIATQAFDLMDKLGGEKGRKAVKRVDKGDLLRVEADISAGQGIAYSLTVMKNREEAELDDNGVPKVGVAPRTWIAPAPDKGEPKEEEPKHEGAQQTTPAAGAMPYATILPGYAQAGDTCGAASLVSALIIWDREHWNPAEPNSRVVTACNLILVEFVRRGDVAVQEWAKHPSPAARDIAASVPDATVADVYEVQRVKLTGDLKTIRDRGRQAGAKISESDYQTIGLALYFLWSLGGPNGLSSAAIDSIQNALGLAQQGSGASTSIQSMDDIFSNSIVIGLQPDQIAQVGWFVKTGQQHAFLIGRLQSGEWFLSDQGPQPAAEFKAASLAVLQASVSAAARSGSYWLYPGTVTDYLKAGGPIPGWLGVKLLAPQTGVASKAQSLIGPGEFLGEVDAGAFTTGDRITRDGFIATAYTLADAQARFPASGPNGGVIVEAPEGVFNLFNTSAVSEANLSQTSLDADDSKDSVLLRRRQTYVHAWLIPGTSGGKKGKWFVVY